jgi:hypothetical protein
MNKKFKPEVITRKEFQRFCPSSTAATVTVDYELWPHWAQKAFDPITTQILFWPHQGPQDAGGYHFENAMGRLTLVRHDPKDALKGYPYNKDVYIFVCASDDTIYQYGPYSKGEMHHWMSESELAEYYLNWPLYSGQDKQRNNKT